MPYTRQAAPGLHGGRQLFAAIADAISLRSSGRSTSARLRSLTCRWTLPLPSSRPSGRPRPRPARRAGTAVRVAGVAAAHAD